MTAVRQAAGLLIFLGLCFGAAAAGGLVTAPQIDTWYATLEKPAWTPPAAVFGPVWTVLYAMMGVAAWLVWRKVGLWVARRALLLFALQLALNSLWSVLFFGLQRPGLAFGDIACLWLAICLTLLAFLRHSPLAALLLVPYLAWVSYASGLNWAIWRLNAG